MENYLKNLIKKQAELFNKEQRLTKLLAKDAMIKPTFFYREEPIEKVINKLKREDCGVCIVVDRNKNFIGEIDDEDLITIIAHTSLKDPIPQILNRGYRREIIWRKAGDLARKHKNIVLGNTTINKVLSLVYKRKKQNIIVVNKERKVIGVITPSSMLRLLSNY